MADKITAEEIKKLLPMRVRDSDNDIIRFHTFDKKENELLGYDVNDRSVTVTITDMSAEFSYLENPFIG